MRMAEVPGIAMREDEVELDLGLSIGGSFRKLPEKSILIDKDGCTDLSHVTLSRTSASGSPLTLIGVSDGDNESVVMDSKERREIHALRRREAKRKREEKQQKRGRSFACQNEEVEDRQRPLKKEKQKDVGSESNVMKNVDLNLSDDQVYSQDNYGTSASLPKQHPAAQMPYPYSSLRYVPFVNGYAFPCLVPYWATAAAINHGNEKSVHQPVPCRSFRPFQMHQNTNDDSLLNGCKLEQNGNKDGRNRKTGSCESPVCSSSVVSDNYQNASSHEGGSSSYAKSNSSNSSSDRRQMTGLSASDHMNNCPSPQHVKPKPYSDNRAQCSGKFVESHVSKASTTGNSGIKEEFIISEKHEVPANIYISNAGKPTPVSSKNVKMENGKPPKPQIQSRNIPSLQQMPCVSTTGLGRHGKTIIGFLYRYSKLEVSILCVCHGESFSPAEFVKHAGGAEVSHPLRHITVLPTHNGIPDAFR